MSTVARGGLRAELGSEDFADVPRWQGARILRSFFSRVLHTRPRDALAICLAGAGVAAILANALYLQPGPHPAPIFAIKARPVSGPNATGAVRVPRPRPSEAAKTDPRSQAEVIADIQRELERRGFYDGPIDGFHGPRTDTAIRDFAQAAGLKPTVEPNPELLETILRSPVKPAGEVRARVAQGAAAPGRGDAIGELITTSSRRVLAVQRALGDFGYGPVKPTGVFGPETKAAIEKFERDRKLPITGQLSDRLLRELAATTGRPLE